MLKIIIVAVSKNNVIGNKGKLPWINSEEMAFFKSVTLNNAVVMGKNTFLSIGKPLVDRINIVLTNSLKLSEHEKIFIAKNIEESICIAQNFGVKKLFFIGGKAIYKSAMGFVDEMIISRINQEYSGDVYFPAIDESLWKKEQTEDKKSFKIETYRRKRQV